MSDILLQYGILGVVVIALAWYVLNIERQHKKERDEWRVMIEKMNDDSTKVIRDHTTILTVLKTLLESRK